MDKSNKRNIEKTKLEMKEGSARSHTECMCAGMKKNGVRKSGKTAYVKWGMDATSSPALGISFDRIRINEKRDNMTKKGKSEI